MAPGNRLLVDDGHIVLDVKEVRGSEIICTVVDGGVLSDRKGINLQGGGLAAPALTDTDKMHIETAVHEVAPDYFAISFVSDASDVEEARRFIQQAGGNAGVIAKISEICEQAEARIVPNMDAQYPRIDETIAMAAMYAAHHYHLKAVLALTESGNTYCGCRG